MSIETLYRYSQKIEKREVEKYNMMSVITASIL